MGGALKIKKEFKKDVQMLEQAPSPFLAMQQKSEEISRSNLSQENMDLRLAVLTAAFNSFVETPKGKNAVRDYLNESAAHLSASLSNIQDQLSDQPQEIMSKYYTHAREELPQIQNNINRTVTFIKAVKKGLKKRMNNPKQLQEYMERAMPMADQKIRECHEDNAKLVGNAEYTQEMTKVVGGTAVTTFAAVLFPLLASKVASSVVGGALMGAGVDLVVAGTANAVIDGELKLTKKDLFLAVAIGGTMGAFGKVLKLYKASELIKAIKAGKKAGKSLVKFSNQEIEIVTKQFTLFKKMAPTLKRIEEIQEKLPKFIKKFPVSGSGNVKVVRVVTKAARVAAKEGGKGAKVAKIGVEKMNQLYTSCKTIDESIVNSSSYDNISPENLISLREGTGGSG
ncbi:hypothetical protein KAW38_03355 [Candidatus Micrarchaeota archaeon]|nr:hypothetical protein [Candidatus Micrarchaeota archaeon]